MKLSEKIIKLRKEAGLSQEEFGNKINVSRQAVSKWESEQTKPDIDKLKEIGKLFNVSFDYLLDDEKDEVESVIEKIEAKPKKKGKKIILKVLFLIILIYLLISLYKFIGLCRFYLIANSFSEENYWISEGYEYNNEPILNHFIQKVGNKRIEESRSPYEKNPLIDENGNVIAYAIYFVDADKEECYTLNYDEELKKYVYHDNKRNASEEELKQMLDVDKNKVKEITFSYIPSDFKSILLTSLNPLYQVSIVRREIYFNGFNRIKQRILLNNDYLVQTVDLQTEFDGTNSVTYSYDYVQDHFKEIQDPLDKYSGNIVKFEDLVQ